MIWQQQWNEVFKLSGIKRYQLYFVPYFIECVVNLFYVTYFLALFANVL